MAQDIVHFSHANGFPAQSYQVMFDCLNEHYEIGYIDRLGHNPKYPVTDSWPYLVDELIDHVESSYTQPVIAVGHSLGGVLSFMAASRRPDLFKSFLMLDAPVLIGVDALAVQMSKRFGWVDRITPAGRTFGRREEWPDEETALEYFRGKGLFRKTDPRCLADYVRFGTEPFEGGIRLRFTAETEVNIYRTLPHRMRQIGRAHPPGGLIYGRESNVIRPFQVSNMRKRMGMYTSSLEGTHLFPLEQPEKTAEKIRQILEKLNTWQTP